MAKSQKQAPMFTAANVRSVVNAVKGAMSRQQALTSAVKTARVRFNLKDESRRRQFNKVVLAQFPQAKRRSVSVTLSRAWSDAMGKGKPTPKRTTLRTKLGVLVEKYGYTRVAATLKALNA